MSPARVVLHLPEKYGASFRTVKHLALYPRIEAALLARGAKVVIEGRPARLFEGALLPGDGDLHIVENGRARGPGYLNATLAYFEGFWHLDPAGVLAESAIGRMAFDPAQVSREKAERFFAAMQARFAATRSSRYGQARAAVQEIPQGAIAVFLQGPAPQSRGHAHCSYREMLRCVAEGAAGRPMVVKAHPLKREMGQAQIAAIRAEGHALIETDANVHDILRRAAVSVSVNSAAALEGFLHGTPAILFGRSDFHHFAETVQDPRAFPQALRAALASRRDYALAFQWYFAERCLCLDAPDFEARLLATLAASGFDAARLGLS